MDVEQAAVDPLRGPFDFAHAGQEGEQVAFGFLADRAADGGGHFILDPLFGVATDMAQVQRLDAALALDHWRVAQQGGESRAVERGGHGQDAQIGAQGFLRVEREGEAEIAVEAAFMDLVEQDCGYARQFGVVLNAPDEDALGQHEQAGAGRLLAVHPRRIADRAAGLFAQHFGNPLGRGAGGEAAGGEQEYLSAAPGLVEQGWGHRRRLARAGWRDQHGVAAGAERSQQVGQDVVDRQGGHGRSIGPFGAVGKIK
ncbi:hypothetical protein IL54_4788 [Sphingobium sp. ba1]|nr:hypothetical protein IL54_4788 [Sphingobium sp. ba1]